jgi:cytochrome P450
MFSFLHGGQHRKQRKKLNPAFSTSNMQQLLPIIQTVYHKLKSVLMENLSVHSEDAYARYLSYYFTVDTASAELAV